MAPHISTLKTPLTNGQGPSITCPPTPIPPPALPAIVVQPGQDNATIIQTCGLTDSIYNYLPSGDLNTGPNSDSYCWQYIPVSSCEDNVIVDCVKAHVMDMKVMCFDGEKKIEDRDELEKRCTKNKGTTSGGKGGKGCKGGGKGGGKLDDATVTGAGDRMGVKVWMIGAVMMGFVAQATGVI